MRDRFLLTALLAAAFLTGCSCATAPPVPRPRPAAPRPAPAAIWPLLGTPAPSAEAIRQRVVCVKVDNEPPARSAHAGVAEADVVYETPIEGEDTRYAALYQSQAPTKAGPVRSARVSDTFIVPQYRALLAHVGGDFVVETALKQTPNVEDMDEFKVSSPYFRSTNGPAPHNDFVSIPAVREAAVKRGFPAAIDNPALEFGSAPASATSSATAVEIAYSPVARAAWAWSSGSMRWQRSFDGSPRGDAGTGAPYEASNVVVLFVVRTQTKALDPAGNPTFAEQLVGSGEAIVFREGKRYDGIWTAGPGAPPRMIAKDGDAIPLAPGKTWFEVVANGTRVTSK